MSSVVTGEGHGRTSSRREAYFRGCRFPAIPGLISEFIILPPVILPLPLLIVSPFYLFQITRAHREVKLC